MSKPAPFRKPQFLKKPATSNPPPTDTDATKESSKTVDRPPQVLPPDSLQADPPPQVLPPESLQADPPPQVLPPESLPAAADTPAYNLSFQQGSSDMSYPTAPPASVYPPPTQEYLRQANEEGGCFGGTLASNYPYTEGTFPSYYEENPKHTMRQPSNVDESTVRKQHYRLLASLFVSICCCCPIGLAAVYYNLQSSKAHEAGQTDLAKAHAHRARLFTLASLAVGIACENVLFLIIIIIVATS